MIESQTIDGSSLNVKLAPKDMPLRTAEANSAKPRPEPALTAQIITVHFDVRDKAVAEVRAEFVLDHATYAQAESAGYFGITADAKSAPVDASSFSADAPVHILVRGDLERIGPYQFDGLDIMNNKYDLREVLMTMTHDAPRSPYHELETWAFVTVQQKTAPDSEPVGFDRAS